MAKNTRVLWLKSDGTIQKLSFDELYGKRVKYPTMHFVFLHPGGEFYTNKSTILAKHMKQIVEILKEV